MPEAAIGSHIGNRLRVDGYNGAGFGASYDLDVAPVLDYVINHQQQFFRCRLFEQGKAVLGALLALLAFFVEGGYGPIVFARLQTARPEAGRLHRAVQHRAGQQRGSGEPQAIAVGLRHS